MNYIETNFPQESESPDRLQKATPLSVRLTPRLRYLTELAAREQQRTLTSFVERAIARALTPEAMTEDADSIVEGSTVGQPMPFYFEGLWDIDPSDRFILFASGRLDLLTDDELRLWKRITKDRSLRSEMILKPLTA